jgi:hypothetical protein
MSDRLAAAVLGALLAGCVPGEIPPSDLRAMQTPDWRWDTNQDQITGARSQSAVLTTMNVKITRSSYQHGAALSLNCVDGRRTLIVVWGFPVSGGNPNTIGFRFAGLDGHEVPADFPNLETQLVDSPKAVNQFLTDAARSSAVYVRVVSMGGGSTAEANFSARGGAAIVAKFKEYCP